MLADERVPDAESGSTLIPLGEVRRGQRDPRDKGNRRALQDGRRSPRRRHALGKGLTRVKNLKAHSEVEKIEPTVPSTKSD